MRDGDDPVSHISHISHISRHPAPLMTRQRLPNCRGSELIDFQCGQFRFTAGQ